jgi:hypothetical protein
VFDQIEKLKQEFTDKYVVVDGGVAELARFDGYVGQVKTVNMNGRALVEFEAWSNIGWYDIDLDYLKVVPKPEAPSRDKEAAAPKAAKPAAKPAAAPAGKKLSPLEMARMQGAAKSGGAKPTAAPTGKQSTADILAAARGAKAATATEAEKESPAAASQKKAAKSGTMNTGDVLAAARANKASAETAAAGEAVAAAVKLAAPADPASAESPATEAPAAEAAAAAKPASSAPAFPPGQRPGVPEILAWCREHDAH